MTTYVHPLGSHLKVHSKNAKPPTERDKPDPGILIILCHGFYQSGTEEIAVPTTIPPLRFATPHGEAHYADYKWFESLVKDGVSLEYDFRHEAPAGSTVTNYRLGKGEPEKAKGESPGTWLSYDKAARKPKVSTYNFRHFGNTGVISSSYAWNLMTYDAGKAYTFDIATLRRACTCLADVFASLGTSPSHPLYEAVCCAFCREFIE